MKYQVVTGITLSDLESSVNEHLQYGWIPYGNLVHTQSGYWAQPLVKLDTSEQQAVDKWLGQQKTS